MRKKGHKNRICCRNRSNPSTVLNWPRCTINRYSQCREQGARPAQGCRESRCKSTEFPGWLLTWSDWWTGRSTSDGLHYSQHYRAFGRLFCLVSAELGLSPRGLKQCYAWYPVRPQQEHPSDAVLSRHHVSPLDTQSKGERICAAYWPAMTLSLPTVTVVREEPQTVQSEKL